MTNSKAHSPWIRRSAAVLTTTLGLVAALVLVPAPAAHADSLTGPFHADAGSLGAIPDSNNPNCGTNFGSRTVTIPVSGMSTSRRLTDAYVGININHTYVSDLVIDLVPPGSSYPAAGGTFVRLFGSLNCTPNSPADLNGGYGFQTGFGSFASAIAAAGSGTVAPGNYAPQDPYSRLSGIFNPNGTWRLVFYDADQGATGTVSAADLYLQQDVTAPGVSFTGGPADNATVTANPTYSFSSSATDLSRFECATDAGAFTTCSSPRTLNLGLGVHTFKVRAVDTSGNFSSVIQRQYNQVADPPPNTEITSGPADGSTVSTAPTFVFGSPDLDVSQFQCRLDGGAWSTCVSPRTETATGTHLFEVRAVDQAGQVDGTPAARNYTYTPVAPDTTPPETQISSGPADGAVITEVPTYGFASPDADTAGFQCSVDGAAFTACASPFQVSVSPGTHTFAVRAFDEVPNYDASPATRTFTLRDLCQEAKDKLATAKAKLAAAIDSGARKAKIQRLRERVHQLRILKNQACS
jgi:subtilisin-like proprotein convertase family protein